jgi:uncharacterized protein YerC
MVQHRFLDLLEYDTIMMMENKALLCFLDVCLVRPIDGIVNRTWQWAMLDMSHSRLYVGMDIDDFTTYTVATVSCSSRAIQ